MLEAMPQRGLKPWCWSGHSPCTGPGGLRGWEELGEDWVLPLQPPDCSLEKQNCFWCEIWLVSATSFKT